MYTMNQLTIIGFTGNDADAHYTPNGTLVVTISVATKESLEEMPTATGRAEQIGTGLFLWQAGGVHSDTDQRLIRDVAGRSAHARV